MKKSVKDTGVREIARRAHVSIATIDRVIHNRTGVSAKTRSKINLIIQELNYQPNILASRLALAFTKALNNPEPSADFAGYRVVAAYPYGSIDIESSVKRIPGYIDKVKKFGVEIVSSIKELLGKVDVVLLETNDGRLHLEQALHVFKAGKRIFIDKPVAASLSGAVAIYEAAKKYNIPIFSASSLRYIKGVQDIDKSQVLGADSFSPTTIEKTHADFFWYGIHGVETLFFSNGQRM